MRRTSPIHSTTKFLKMCDKEETLGSNQRENYTLHTEEQRQQILPWTKANHFLLVELTPLWPIHRVKKII